MILVAASLILLGVVAGAVDRFAETDHESHAARLTRMLLWAAATVVVVQAALGALGLLTPLATFGALAALAIGAVSWTRWRRPPRAQPPPPEPVSVASTTLLAVLVALLVFRLWTGLHKTTFLYDTLSYHLHAPATWMHAGRITIVPAVFGDPSAAYAPSNLELWFLFLMAPLRSDYLAGVGQLPFAALAAAAIMATIREAGGYRLAAVAGALMFLLVPEVWGQIATAMNDLGLAACLLAALPFVIRLWTAARARRADLLAVATAIGLAIGTKYAAAALAAPFVALAAAGWWRRRPRDWGGGLLAVAVVGVTGGFWYVRNAVVTGNPLYPVAFPGLALPALYGRAEMRAWEYHVPVGDLRALGAILIAAGIGFCCAFIVAFARLWGRDVAAAIGFRRDAAGHARAWRNITAGLLAALLAIYWFVIPYQESRFVFVVLGVAAVIMGQAAQGSRNVALVLASALVCAVIEWPATERLLLIPAAWTAIVVLKRWPMLLERVGRRALSLGAAAAGVLLLVALGAGARGYAARIPAYAGGDDMDLAWRWFRANVRDARVAYTGNNLAFPLAGEQLGNRVSYVNVAGAPSARLHDFGPPGDGTAEPAPYRRGANAGTWIANLRATRTQVLFVSALYPIVRRTIDADGDGFPVERAWADARPDVFRLRYASAAARVYDVNLGAP